MKRSKLTRYSVRFLLLLTAIVAMSVGYVVNHNRQQLVAVRKLEAAGISVWHEFKGPNTGPSGITVGKDLGRHSRKRLLS